MSPQRTSRQRGISLTELMIALALGSLLTVATVSLFSGTRNTHRTVEALSRAQENGRFAIDLLVSEIRQAGFDAGCSTAPNNLLNEQDETYRPELYDFSNPVRGWRDAGENSLTRYIAGNDTVLIVHAAPASGATASGNTPANANTIQLSGSSAVKQGQVLMVADSEGCDIFQNRSNDNAASLARGSGGGSHRPGNKNPANADFSHAYGPDMDIQLLRSAVYFIGEGTGGMPALRRALHDRGTTPTQEELVEGIVALRLCFGTDDDADQDTDTYQTADNVTDWSSVRSVRVTLVAVGPSGGRSETPQRLGITECDGTEAFIEPPERRVGVVFTTSVAMRNALP